MKDKILWQPQNIWPNHETTNPYNFSILLDWEFANKMMSTKIPEERQENFSKAIGERFRYSFPLNFYENTALLESINIGENGRWLNAEKYSLENIKEGKNENLIYHSHNITTSISQNTLMSIFECWAKYHPSLFD